MFALPFSDTDFTFGVHGERSLYPSGIPPAEDYPSFWDEFPPYPSKQPPSTQMSAALNMSTFTSSSPPSSISSYDESAPSRLISPEAPSVVRDQRVPHDLSLSQLMTQTPTSPASTTFSFQFHSHYVTPQNSRPGSSMAMHSQITRAPDRAMKHPREMPSPASNVNEGKSLSGAVIAKRRRICPGPSGVKPTGACTRCKRLKMKCTFPDEENACSRCTTGNHECVVLGRKPRSPGMREVLQKQIREKDSMIDNLLQQINPTPSLATPLSIVPSRLALTEAQREQYRDVLSWFEKAQSGVKGDLREKIDVSPLEEGYEEGADSDDEGSQDSNSPDACAAALARQLRFLPGESAPAGLLVSAVLDSTKKKHSTEQTSARQDDDDNQDLRIEAGIGSKNYFQPGPSANLDLRRLIIERQAAPEILLSGLVTYDDVPILFQLYFKWINPVIPVLDENIHTPAAVLSRCPFLFTVVCALASRYYNEKPDMYALAIHIAKASAANAFLDGWKTIEMCQAYILMGAYTPPARKWEEDRYWFFTGIAFRLGIELNLSRVPPVKPANERDERELLNRTRTWIICYIMDRCICVNLGKPFMVPEDDTIRNIEQKFLGSKYQHPGDGYLVSLVELLRIITRFSETTNPILAARQDPSDAELYILHKSIDDELKTWFNVADERCRDDGEPHDQGHVLQMALMHSVYQYCRLVIYSYGLQHVMKRGSLEVDSVFFVGCLQSASAVLNLFMDGLIPTGFIGNCPEQILALTAFATVILLKFLRPEYSEKLDQLQEDRIIELIQRLLNVLNAESENDAEDDQRITKRYARFVQHILGPHIAQLKKRRELSRSAASVRELPASGASFLSATSAQSELPSAPVDTSLNQPPLSEKEELPAIIVSPMWEDIFSGPNSAPMPPLTGFSDTDFLAAMMSFPDQSWMGVVDLA